MTVARRYVVRGRVQGVGFRWFVQNAAIREGVRGWVCNRADGRVEAYVEGDSDAVLRVERALRMGPPAGRVDEVHVLDEAPVSGATTFRIVDAM